MFFYGAKVSFLNVASSSTIRWILRTMIVCCPSEWQGRADDAPLRVLFITEQKKAPSLLRLLRKRRGVPDLMIYNHQASLENTPFKKVYSLS